jgi:formate hydrogenlyase subunit 6/NADH:ubiquinone oxidoreductase subunit I
VAFYWSIVTIVLTVVLGRVFCGWVCPLGTLNNIVSTLRKKRSTVMPPGLQKVKYFVLVFVLVSAALGLQAAGVLDPISLTIRSMSVSVYPAFNYGVRAAFDSVYALDPPYLVDASEAVYSWLKASVLSFEQPAFRQGFFIGLLFLIILGLNLLERRFWCRYLCPLGAMLGVLSRYSLLKRSVSEGCTECGVCNSHCPSGADPHVKGGWKSAECMYCYNCDDVCPESAVSFGFGGEMVSAPMDLGRRRVLVSALSGAVAVPLVKATPLLAPTEFNPRLIRPPGAREEGEFLKRCVRCGECMKVCITNGLQPTLLEAGLEGIWTPLLVPTTGYCEFRCTLCGQVCPTGAIERLGLQKKTKVKIGLAMLDKGRCLPWAHGRPCIVCEEVCPTPKKAIWLEEARIKRRDGSLVTVRQPHVDLELCIGCGICETKCPVVGRPAIYVTSIGESRSEDSALLI